MCLLLNAIELGGTKRRMWSTALIITAHARPAHAAGRAPSAAEKKKGAGFPGAPDDPRSSGTQSNL
jgi:hypothetical protein